MPNEFVELKTILDRQQEIASQQCVVLKCLENYNVSKFQLRIIGNDPKESVTASSTFQNPKQRHGEVYMYG